MNLFGISFILYFLKLSSGSRFSISTNSIFYAAGWKTLKGEFRHAIDVANLKLKALFDQPQNHSRDRVTLQSYHQQPSCTTTWFTSMDYQSAICSTVNLTKIVDPTQS